jgi:two-component system, NtrC family, sensor kinase
MEDPNKPGLVLIADDNAVNLDLLFNALEPLGMDLLFASDGTEVLEIVERETPDVILLDALMPGLDGFETCKQLKQNPATTDIPVIFMTSLTDTHDRVKGLHAGAVDYLTKPFEHAELLVRVRNQVLLRRTTLALKKKNLELGTEIHERAAAQQALVRAINELERRTEELHVAQVRVVKLEKQATEIRMAGGFAHEMRNALASTGLRLNVVYTSAKGRAGDSLCNQNLGFLKEISLRTQENMSGDALERVGALLRGLDRNEQKILKALSGISSDIERALVVTKRILEYSQYGAEKRGTDPVIMKDIVDKLVLGMTENLAKSDISIVVDADVTCVALGTDTHFDLILRNIVLNAIDALMDTPAGSERTIKIGVQHEGPNVLLQITDSGTGITAENLPNIFEPFFSTKPNSKTGLGLSVVEKLLWLYDGTIDVQSEGNRGTTVHLRLPRVPAP